VNLQLKNINKKSYFVALGISTLVYFLFIRVFQDWLYHGLGIDLMPEGLFFSYGLDFFQPEPLEIALYLVGFLIIPVVAFLLTPMIPRIQLRIPDVLLTIFGKFSMHGLHRASVENIFRKFWPLGLIILAALLFNPSFPVDVHHFNFYLGSVNDVYQGKAILYESSNLYGLFNVYFLVILFQLIPMTYPMIALISTVFYLLFFIAIFVFLRMWLKSYTLATIATASLVAVLYLFPSGPDSSALFLPALSPLRWGAYVIVLFFILGFSRTARPFYQQAALMTSGLAIFWNFDTGVYLSVATLGALAYLNFASNRSLTAVFKLLGNYLLYLLTVFAAVNVINRLIYQAWPDWSFFLRDAKFFTAGAAMTPLPAVGLFEIIVFAYLVTLVLAMYRLIQGQKFDLILVFLGIYGATFSGIFSQIP